MCTSCTLRDTECIYDTRDEGETRNAALKRRNAALEEELARLRLIVPEKDQVKQHGSKTKNVILIDEDETMRDLHGEQLAPESGTIDNHAASVLGALVNKTDQESIAILTALRSGVPWETAAGAILTHSSVNEPQWLDILSPELSGSDGSSRSTTSGAEGVPVSGVAESRFNRHVWLDEIVSFSNTAIKDHPVQSIQVINDETAHRTFGNLPFSSSIGANHYPSCVQDKQKQIFHMPIWCIFPLVEVSDYRDPFVNSLMEMSHDLGKGVNIDEFCGSYAQISALFDRESYEKASRLSQVVAQLVESIRPYSDSIETGEDDTSFLKTRCAMMWLLWCLWRWILQQTPDTYEAIPESLRPTPWQLFSSHPLVFAFLISPNLRDYLCHTRSKDCRWLTMACITAACDDLGDGKEFYAIDPKHEDWELSDAAKKHVARPEIWSLGASVRPYFRNIDRFVRIRRAKHPVDAGK